MDVLKTTKKNIEELNQRFFFILENFVPNYIKYLQQPTNQNITSEILHVTTVNNKILTTIEQHKKNGYKVSQIPEDDERMNIIGQNGNEGLHYDNEEDTSLEKNDEKK